MDEETKKRMHDKIEGAVDEAKDMLEVCLIALTFIDHKGHRDEFIEFCYELGFSNPEESFKSLLN